MSNIKSQKVRTKCCVKAKHLKRQLVEKKAAVVDKRKRDIKGETKEAQRLAKALQIREEEGIRNNTIP